MHSLEISVKAELGIKGQPTSMKQTTITTGLHDV